ncbi:MAG: type II toxin-antitoxin system RelE/ParE family toxin [Devosia sp.]
MRVVYAPAAFRDLLDIGDYIAIDNRRRARTFVAELRAACRSLGHDSLCYPYQQELTDIRRMPVGNYLVLYRVLDDRVQIVRIVHAARDIGIFTL